MGKGITVLLSAAQMARSLDLETVVVPCQTSTPLHHHLPEPYGDLQPPHPKLQQQINRSCSHLITRWQPANKTTLDRHLLETDLFVSFDPLSSLAVETTRITIGLNSWICCSTALLTTLSWRLIRPL